MNVVQVESPLVHPIFSNGGVPQAYFPPPLAASQMTIVSRADSVQTLPANYVRMGGPVYQQQQAIIPHQFTNISIQERDVLPIQERIYNVIQEPQRVLYSSRVPQQHIVYQTVQPAVVEQRPAYYRETAAQVDPHNRTRG